MARPLVASGRIQRLVGKGPENPWPNGIQPATQASQASLGGGPFGLSWPDSALASSVSFAGTCEACTLIKVITQVLLLCIHHYSPLTHCHKHAFTSRSYAEPTTDPRDPPFTRVLDGTKAPERRGRPARKGGTNAIQRCRMQVQTVPTYSSFVLIRVWPGLRHKFGAQSSTSHVRSSLAGKLASSGECLESAQRARERGLHPFLFFFPPLITFRGCD